MKAVQVTEYELAIDYVGFGFVYGETGDFIDVEAREASRYTEELGCSEALIKALAESFELLKEALREDLISLYKLAAN